jgi:effector-binding domain-containing protein
MKFTAMLAALWLAAASAFAAETPAPASPTPPSPVPIPAPVATPTPTTTESATGQVVELATHPCLYLEAKANREEVYGAILGALAKIRAAIDKAGLKPQGHALGVFLTADDDGFTFRAMVPLESAPDPKTALADGVKIGQTPVGKAMKFEHRGEYDEIDSTYDAITAWLDEKGVDAQDVFVEEYLNETKSADDPNLQVDIFVLLR